MAKESGAIISYDPNYRAPLWFDQETAVTEMRSVLELADIVKISEDETTLITGRENHTDAVSPLLDQGTGCVVVTLDSVDTRTMI